MALRLIISDNKGGRVSQIPGSDRPGQGALLRLILPHYTHFLCILIQGNVTSRLPTQQMPSLSAKVGLEVVDKGVELAEALHHFLVMAAALGRSAGLNVSAHLHIDLLDLSA